MSFLQLDGVLQDLHSFPTRRSSDLATFLQFAGERVAKLTEESAAGRWDEVASIAHAIKSSAMLATSSQRDRKSTRLNSSHPSTSYAVFCLKKKKSLASSKSLESSNR